MRVFNRELSPGFQGIRETVKTIAALAWLGSDRPKIQRLTSEIDRTDATTTIRDMYDLARKAIRYELDPLGIEQVQGIDALLTRKRGDCDDYSVFLGALGIAMDFPTRITVARRKGRKQFHHVFPEFFIQRKWRPIDATVDNPPGTYPSQIATSVTFPVLKRRLAV